MPLVINKLQNWAKDENAPGYSAENRDVAGCAPRTPGLPPQRVIPSRDNPPSGEKVPAPLIRTRSEDFSEIRWFRGEIVSLRSPQLRWCASLRPSLRWFYRGGTLRRQQFEGLLRSGRERCSREVRSIRMEIVCCPGERRDSSAIPSISFAIGTMDSRADAGGFGKSSRGKKRYRRVTPELSRVSRIAWDCYRSI